MVLAPGPRLAQRRHSLPFPPREAAHARPEQGLRGHVGGAGVERRLLPKTSQGTKIQTQVKSKAPA